MLATVPTLRRPRCGGRRTRTRSSRRICRFWRMQRISADWQRNTAGGRGCKAAGCCWTSCRIRPDMPTKIPDAPGELGCCLSLLARHPDDTADGTLLRALLKSADAGGQAMEKYCRMLHRDLAARLRTHNPLPGRLLPYLCRAAEERTGNP